MDQKILHWLIYALFMASFLWLTACSSESESPTSSPQLIYEDDIPLSTPDPSFAELYIDELEKEDPNYNGKSLLFGWTPTGAIEKVVKSECHPRHFEQEYLSGELSQQDRLQLLKNYFKDCGEDLSDIASQTIITLALMERAKFNHEEQPLIRRFSLALKSGESISGFMAFKKDGKPRPTVIIRTGLTNEGKPKKGLNTLLYMHLFDESPFNVVVVGSQTGSNNVESNSRLIFGGFWEGQESLELGRWLLNESEFKSYISDLHLFGFSMGGHSVLYSSLYNSHLEKPIFKSVLAYCPLVNANSTMAELFKDRLRGKVMFELLWLEIMKSFGSITYLSDLFSPKNKPDKEEFTEIVGEASVRFLSQKDPMNFPQPFKGRFISSQDDFWKLNNFLDYSHLIKTPTFVWGSKNDLVVKNSLNTKILEEKHKDTSQGNIEVLNLPYGNHCGKSTAYEWPAITSILRGYFLSHSSNYDQWISNEVQAFEKGPSKQYWIHTTQRWKAKKGADYFNLYYRVFNQFRDDCFFWNYENAPNKCYQKIRYKVPFSEVSLIQPDIPTTDEQARALTRWANANLIIEGINGLLVGTTDAPMVIKKAFHQ